MDNTATINTDHASGCICGLCDDGLGQLLFFPAASLTNRQVRRRVVRARLSGRLVKILYRDAGGNETVRTVAVVSILHRFADGTSQFEAWCCLRNARRIFYVERVQAIETLAERWGCPCCGERWRAADEADVEAGWSWICPASCSEAL